MKISPVRFAFSAFASLAFAASANAAPILDFAQATPANTITSTNAGNNTTFATTGTQVGVTLLAGVPPVVPNTQFTENFNFTSTTAPTGTDGNITQTGFSGTFSYVAANGVVQVAGNVFNGILSTITTPGGGGTTATFNTSNVVFTTVAPAILQQAFGFVPALNTLQGNFSLTLNNLNPVTTTSLNFTGRAGGIITAQVVPEPASVVMTSMALVAGLGGLGLRRMKASRA